MDKTGLPAHVGIIMDGNGRWAKKHGLPRIAGHQKGADVFGSIARHAAKTGVGCLTVYAFSTENWKRPPEEITGIMNILRGFLKDTGKYKKDNMRVRVIGDKTALDADIRDMIASLERDSRDNTGMRLTVAVNYGGRAELLHAAKSMAELFAAGAIKDLNGLDESDFSRYLYTDGLPDADLIIRTSGELRISNFMLWQSAYAEYVFSDVLWPDFKPAHFDAALAEFAGRARRLGGA